MRNETAGIEETPHRGVSTIGFELWISYAAFIDDLGCGPGRLPAGSGRYLFVDAAAAPRFCPCSLESSCGGRFYAIPIQTTMVCRAWRKLESRRRGAGF